LELTNNLLADKRAEQGGAVQDVGAGVVDRGEDKGRGFDRVNGVGEEGRGGALWRWVGIGLRRQACRVGNEAAGVEVGDAQSGIMEALGNVRVRLIGGLSWNGRTDKEEQTSRKTKH